MSPCWLATYTNRQVSDMVRICILHAQDHRKHVVIKRQIALFIKAGFQVSVVDQVDLPSDKMQSTYHHVSVARIQWQFLVHNLWRLIQRIPIKALSDRFWICVLGLRMLSNTLRMALVALQMNADYYVADDLQSAWAALLASRLRKRPVIYSAHELESEQGDDNPLRRQFLFALERKLIPQVDYFVVPNESRAKVYVQRYSPRTEPVVVLNCPPYQSGLEPSNRLRELLDLPQTTRVVLYFGALIPYRALDKLVQSAALFEKNTVLVIIGEQGEYFKGVLEPLYFANGLQNRVFFLPYIAHDEISNYVASADLGIVIYENVNLNNYLCAPLKLYELIMMRVPVAACNFPEITELFEKYPVGVTFDPQEPMSIAKADLETAVRLDPSLICDAGWKILEYLIGTASGPYVADPDAYLNLVYDNLPVSVSPFLAKKRRARAILRMKTFYSAYASQDWYKVRLAFLEAIVQDRDG